MSGEGRGERRPSRGQEVNPVRPKSHTGVVLKRVWTLSSRVNSVSSGTFSVDSSLPHVSVSG